MTIDNQIEVALRRVTERSTHKRHMVGAVIVSKRGEIISDGCAHLSNIRLKELNSIHAEIHSLGRGRHRNMKGATVYVMAKARKSGNVVLGKPCLTCAIALKSVGVKRAIYSTDGDNFASLDLASDLSKLKVYKKGDW